MAQVKKQEVYDAIIDSAYTLFRDKSYTDTTVSQIASLAGVSTSNIYVYFSSKLQILYAICEPWLRNRVAELAERLDGIEDAETRLRLILRTLWYDIPNEDGGLAINLMQGLSTAKPEDTYRRDLLLWAEDELTRLIRTSLPADRSALVDGTYLAHVLFMAFDGFSINSKLKGPSERIDGIVDLMVGLLLGHAPSGHSETAVGRHKKKP